MVIKKRRSSSLFFITKPQKIPSVDEIAVSVSVILESKYVGFLGVPPQVVRLAHIASKLSTLDSLFQALINIESWQSDSWLPQYSNTMDPARKTLLARDAS